jgi:hypothetical protein
MLSTMVVAIPNLTSTLALDCANDGFNHGQYRGEQGDGQVVSAYCSADLGVLRRRQPRHHTTQARSTASFEAAEN